MWELLFLLLIKFQIFFEDLVTALIPRLFKFLCFFCFFSIMLVELLGKIIYLCNELLFEKLLFEFLENIHVREFWEFLFWHMA